MLQWLGLGTFIVKGPGSVPRQGTKILQAAQYGPNTHTHTHTHTHTKTTLRLGDTWKHLIKKKNSYPGNIKNYY